MFLKIECKRMFLSAALVKRMKNILSKRETQWLVNWLAILCMSNMINWLPKDYRWIMTPFSEPNLDYTIKVTNAFTELSEDNFTYHFISMQ